jgi:hypothetical protein
METTANWRRDEDEWRQQEDIAVAVNSGIFKNDVNKNSLGEGGPVLVRLSHMASTIGEIQCSFFWPSLGGG